MNIEKNYHMLHAIMANNNQLFHEALILKALDGDFTSSVDLPQLASHYQSILAEYSLSDLRLAGIPLNDLAYVHSILMWGVHRWVFKIPKGYPELLLSTNPPHKLPYYLFDHLTAQSTYIDVSFGTYDGILVLKDAYHDPCNQLNKVVEVSVLGQDNQFTGQRFLLTFDADDFLVVPELDATTKAVVNLICLSVGYYASGSTENCRRIALNANTYEIGNDLHVMTLKAGQNLKIRMPYWQGYWQNDLLGNKQYVLKLISPTTSIS
ncbi:hypothetical protein BKE30_13970 [Alkanindiges hydrocarboniclasticus]|uniref:Uncharacterized protein n=1 Tax=Alkanindiges hydrocarboniclasticus TaxID=1907941 RepID=A0A1S8CSI0_9GAMM|nr:hypothetical protein [Alkanindiges hydrocarboniclasticus]ONG37667.1 hypothetical protein BKE30_13970 [Alkanindiges hydrocarboniclasticus]